MGMFAGAFGGSSSVGSHDSWLVRAISPKTDAGTYVSEYTAMHLPVVYAAVGVISDAVGQLPVDVFQAKNGRKTKVNDHPVAHLLNFEPNPYMSPFVLRNAIQSHSLLWGNGYMEPQRRRSGEMAALWPLLPDSTGIVKDRKGIRYFTTIDGEQYPLAPSKVAHIPALGFDGLVGYSPIWMARQAVGLGLAMEKFGAKFFSNDAKSGGFVHYPGQLSEKASKNIQDSLQKQGGLDNAHRVKVLEEGAKFVQTTIPPEDAQFLGSREFQIAEIARIYRVPLHMLQSHEKSTSWGSGIEEMTLGFVHFTLMPWLVRWEQELNRKLFTASERKEGLFVKFNVTALLRGDAASRSAFYKEGIDSGWLLKNEAREKEDLNPIEGLDDKEGEAA